MIVIRLSKEQEAEALRIFNVSKGTLYSEDACFTGEDLNMFVGQLGEQAVRYWFDTMGIKYETDPTPYAIGLVDKFDLLVRELKIDVKTRNQPNYTRLLEKKRIVDSDKVKDVYISAKLMTIRSPYEVGIVGWVYGGDFKLIGKEEDLGYGKPTYCIFDEQLRSLEELLFILQ